jgi:hypothetical protein
MSPLPAVNPGGSRPLTMTAASPGTVSTRMERWALAPSSQLFADACDGHWVGRSTSALLTAV